MSWLAGVKSFLLEKFWLPVTNESVFYNPFNTAVYSALFAVAAAYLGLPALRKLKISLDRDFFVGIAPFVLLGGTMRSLKDINAINSILLETPFIYLLMFGLVVGSIIASKKLESRTETSYHRYLFMIGSAALLLTLPFYSLNNLQGFIMILGLGALWIPILYLVSGYFDLDSASFLVPVGAHYADATVTAIALLFPGTAEKHVLARAFIDLFGPIPGMFLMKTLIIVPATIYIIRNVEGEEKLYYLFLVAVLGSAIATRNLVSFVTLT